MISESEDVELDHPKLNESKDEIVKEKVKNTIKPKNEGKNVPKNFGKAIIAYMEKN